MQACNSYPAAPSHARPCGAGAELAHEVGAAAIRVGAGATKLVVVNALRIAEEVEIAAVATSQQLQSTYKPSQLQQGSLL